MWAVPLELREANAYVEMNHRHHAPVHRDKYRIGCADENGLHGVIQIGRPVSRMLDDGMTLEVVRCCTDGTRNVCSFLYARAARVARELGYRRMITYILDSESGRSLLACGWHKEADNIGGGEWDRPGRPRALWKKADQGGLKKKYPTETKQRWGCEL